MLDLRASGSFFIPCRWRKPNHNMQFHRSKSDHTPNHINQKQKLDLPVKRSCHPKPYTRRFFGPSSCEQSSCRRYPHARATTRIPHSKLWNRLYLHLAHLSKHAKSAPIPLPFLNRSTCRKQADKRSRLVSCYSRVFARTSTVADVGPCRM